MRTIRHGGAVTTIANVAQWTPIRHTCGAVVQFMRTGSDQDSRLWCGACRAIVKLSETDARGPVVVVTPGSDAKAAV